MTTKIDKTQHYISLRLGYDLYEDEDCIYLMDRNRELARFSKHISLEALQLAVESIRRKQKQHNVQESTPMLRLNRRGRCAPQNFFAKLSCNQWLISTGAHLMKKLLEISVSESEKKL